MRGALPPSFTRRLKHRHLVLLSDIAHHGSLTRVAAATGISQPAATKALAEAEDIFGAPLFTRTGRSLQPTPLGELALVRARRVLNDLDSWAREAEALRGGHAAHLQVGVVPYVSSELLASAISTLHRQHGVSLTLHRATSDHLLPMLGRHELDCVIGRAPTSSDLQGLTYDVLYHQRLCLIAHRELAQRLARRKADWATVAQMDWVLPETNTPTRLLIDQHFVRAGLRAPVPMLEAYSVDVIEDMLNRNATLVSAVPTDIAREICQRGKLGMIGWDFGWNLPPLNLIRRTRDQPLAAEAFLADILRELCRAGVGPAR